MRILQHTLTSNLPFAMKRALIALGIVAALAVALWLGFQAGDSTPEPAGGALGAAPMSRTAVDPMLSRDVPRSSRVTNEAPAPGAAISPGIIPPSPGELMPVATPPSGPELVHQWLSSSTDIPTIANTMLKGFPSLEAKDHLHAVGNLVALVSDDRFAGLKRLLLDPKTSLEAKEFLFRDALSRGDLVKLPLLLAVMQQRDHPSANEAHDVLKQQLGADFGANYGQWQAKITEVLRAQQ